MEKKVKTVTNKNIIVKEGKLVKEYKSIEKGVLEKIIIKKIKLIKNNNKLILKEITNNFEKENKENEIV